MQNSTNNAVVFKFQGVEDSVPGKADFVGVSGWNDRIDLSAIDANDTIPGNQDFVYRAGGAVNVGEVGFGGRVGDHDYVWLTAMVNADAIIDFEVKLAVTGLGEGTLIL